jgi:hypothetical protein
VHGQEGEAGQDHDRGATCVTCGSSRACYEMAERVAKAAWLAALGSLLSVSVRLVVGPHVPPLLQVVIEKGMRNDDKIVFRGQADEAPGVEAGDLIFVIREAEHAVFKRAGCDLIMRKQISLREALTGVRFVVTHLDGTPVIVTSSPGQVRPLLVVVVVWGRWYARLLPLAPPPPPPHSVLDTPLRRCTCLPACLAPNVQIVAPGDVLAVVGKGMPMKGNPFVKGDLCIKFDVQFPKAKELTEAQLAVSAGMQGVHGVVGALSWATQQCSFPRHTWSVWSLVSCRRPLQVLRDALPSTPDAEPAPATDEDTEVTVLTEVDEDAVRERQRQMRAEHDSDDEGGHGGGQRVQCAQQ